ncbi:MAG: FtsX-like permease family protein [Tissierellia bacterium]|nr:FtsX-like permease family protein [Tissierellia bacterium]
MNKKTLWKDNFKEITHSKGRFFSIMTLTFLSVLALVGIKNSGMVLRNTADDFFDQTKYQDITIRSTLGLDERDEVLADIYENTEYAEFDYSYDVYIKDSSDIIRLQSMPKTMSKALIVEGKLPEKMDEIALDYNFAKDRYKIGDIINITDKDQSGEIEELRLSSFKITALVLSPEYISVVSKGTAAFGSGDLDGFALTDRSLFDMDYFTVGRIKLKNSSDYPASSKEYKDYVNEAQKDLKKLFYSRPPERLKKVKTEAEEKIIDGEKEIEDAKIKLSDADKKLVDARIKLNDGHKKYDDGVIELREETIKNQKKIDDAKQKLEDAKLEIEEGEEKLADAKKTLQEKEEELEDARIKLNDGKKELEDAYKEYEDGKADYEDGKRKLELGEEMASWGLRGFMVQVEKIKNDRDDAKLQVKNAEEELLILRDRKIRLVDKLAESSDDKQKIKNEIVETDLIIAETVEYRDSKRMEYERLDLKLDEIEELSKQSMTYEEMLQAKNDLDEAKEKLEEAKVKLDDAKADLKEHEKEFYDGEQKLIDAKETLKEKEIELEDAKKLWQENMLELEDAEKTFKTEIAKAQKKLDDAAIDIAEGEEEYADGLKEFREKSADAKVDIASGEEKIADAKDDISKLKEPTYYIDTREDESMYFEYYDSTNKLDVLAVIFSSLSVLIAMFVVLTTMTRLVDERRMQIGTLKSLGYDNFDINTKYLLYGSVTAILGTIAGTLVGHYMLTPLVFRAYTNGFVIKEPILNFSWPLTLLGGIIAMACTTLSSFLAVRSSLKENAAELLRPKAPKVGMRIMLERIGFIWKRLSFKKKITARNLFRYKKRMFMTLLGVCGCTGLMFMGFGLRDSITGIIDKQYSEIQHYDYIIAFDDGITPNERADINYKSYKDDRIYDTNYIYLKKLDLVSKKGYRQNVNLIAAIEDIGFGNMINLEEVKTKNSLTLPKDGALITEKLAKDNAIKANDKMTIQLNDQDVEIAVVSSVKNFVSNYIYMDKDYLEEITGEKVVQNSIMISINKDMDLDEDKLLNEYLDLDGVSGVIKTKTLINNLENVTEALNIIVIVIVILASMLAFVVLYNLTNINISERNREISTLKVLGMYTRELTKYIYRETYILTTMGSILGIFLGLALHAYIVRVFSPESLMMDPQVRVSTYIVSVLLTFLFSALVEIFMYFKMKHIDMVEALKSVD